jgi:hypothetical protein
MKIPLLLLAAGCCAFLVLSWAGLAPGTAHRRRAMSIESKKSA